MYAYYEIDPIGFIERLCENKDEPELQCNGQCHLKKISQASKEEHTPSQVVAFEDIVFYRHVLEDFDCHLYESPLKKVPLIYINLYAFNYNYSCFHPPQA